MHLGTFATQSVIFPLLLFRLLAGNFFSKSKKRTFFVVWPALPPNNTRCAWRGLVGGDGDFFLFIEDFLIHDSRGFMIF